MRSMALINYRNQKFIWSFTTQMYTKQTTKNLHNFHIVIKAIIQIVILKLMKPEFDQLEATLKTLEIIANNYLKDSIEYQSMQLSTQALLFIYTEGHINQFANYLQTLNNPLTHEQKDLLNKNGIAE
jgi:hypothetical protein